jgi:ribonuclease-3
MESTDRSLAAAKGLAPVFAHEFRNRSLLREALTHGSAANRKVPNYERLEFLGDRVLSLVVAEMLFRAFPEEDEGQLARRYASLVRQESLAEVARQIGLGKYLVLSRGEDDSGGRQNQSLLADVCEAVIAALYLDAGLKIAAGFIERYWSPMMARAVRPPTDAKTALQEWLQGRGEPLPAYRIVERTGPDHAPSFTIEVSAGAANRAIGCGPSRRIAEQQAAAALLKRMGVDV